MKIYTLLVVLYICITLVWTCLWIPFGIGYSGMPWPSKAFQIGIRIWAWGHAVGGVWLLGYGSVRKRTWWPVACALLLSLYSLLAMESWFVSYVSRLEP